MSMQADLRNPELGYFDEGMKLSDASVYASACRPFGLATTLPPVAYRSKMFLELENEKIWTRGWAAIGLLQQIPRPGDLLPLTLGMHGIHVQRQADGSIVARMNRHQHGGCRFVPEQCRAGQQTKCSITSCNYTRDADVMPGGENGDDTDVMYKFIGLTPERLTAIRCETWGPFIFVNLDPECGPLETWLGHLPEISGLDIEQPLKLSGRQWLDFQCNWKMAGGALTGLGMAPAGGNVGAHATPKTFCMTEVANAGLELKFIWLFPNLLLAVGRDHIAVTLLQATATEKTLTRNFWLTPESKTASTAAADFAQWVSFLKTQGGVAEHMHRQQILLGTSSRQGTTSSDLPLEDNPCAYALNRFLAHRLQIEHHYYWNAPIMDAAMMMRRGR